MSTTSWPTRVLRYMAGIACAVAVGLCAGGSLAQQADDAPPTATDDAEGEQVEPDVAPAGADERRSSELYEVAGIDDAFRAAFVDGRPLDDQQREKLLALLYRMRRMGTGPLLEMRKSIRTLGRIGDDPAGFRGDVLYVPGMTTLVTREELDEPLRERFGCDAWYRCRIVTFLGIELTVYTLSAPQKWPLDTPMRETSHMLGAFVKVMPPSEAAAASEDETSPPRTSLLFVAPRVAWHPASMLGQLGMDYGLFDDVRDRAGLEERECFYEMLAAVRRAESGQIEAAAGEQMVGRRDMLERVARNPHQRSKDRAAAQRALERATENCDDVVPLFNEPAEQRGELFIVSGEALRAVEIRIDDPAIAERLGIDHYYEVDVVTVDSQNNPLVFCVTELPDGMPLGESIHQGVRVAGFFFKSWAFDSRKTATTSDQRRQQLAPLLVARSLQLLKPPEPQPPGMLLAGGLAALVLAGGAVAWYVRRGDRRAWAKAGGSEGPLPETISLDAPQDAPEQSG